MSYEAIISTTERLASEFALSDPAEPESIKRLLPVLKSIHAQCMEKNLKSEAEQVVKARHLIDSMKENELPVNGGLMSDLGAFVSDFSAGVTKLNFQKAPDMPDMTSGQKPDREQDGPCAELGEKLDEFSVMIGAFCPGKQADFDDILSKAKDLAKSSETLTPSTFHDISTCCKQHIENTGYEDFKHTKTVEECIVLLKSILNYLKKGEAFEFDFSDVLELLEENRPEKQAEKKIPPKAEKPETRVHGTPEKISDDDIEILMDFISEAQESLNTIEVSLIELEDDPGNTDIINDIFRPFHTIKGVSGFLSLGKINRLAHTTENLLDSARSGDFTINHAATDAILASVDTLKALLENEKQSVTAGYRQPDDDIDVDILRDKLRALQISLTKADKEPLGEILVRKKGMDQKCLDQALEIQKKHPEKKIGEILVEEKKVAPSQVASALMDQSGSKRKVDTQVKVSTQRLDDLVDYAGELVIAQSMLRQQTLKNASLSQTVSQLGQIVNNMQNIAMSMRMIPIKATFMKMIRLVRDLSRKSGKNISLSMTGEDTEIDRNVVDALYEPMVHMIRNACDHGIEPAPDRLKSGKPEQGSIYLRAYHKGGNIVIEIEDDGKGLDRDNIFNKAKSTGLITGEEQMTDAQVFDLIMQPGFSTAKEITDVSGRGVGMDVVKDGIEKFRGHLDIESEKGAGTRFIISMPLTLAIIDGMLVRVDEERYVIPTITIQKAFKPGPREYFTVEGKGEMVKDRGSLIPLIRIDEIYETGSGGKSIEDCLVVVVESKEDKRAFLIDELLGKDEYVIKSLGGNMDDVQGIAGGAILADGKVGLILDVHGIFSLVSKK